MKSIRPRPFKGFGLFEPLAFRMHRRRVPPLLLVVLLSLQLAQASTPGPTREEIRKANIRAIPYNIWQLSSPAAPDRANAAKILGEVADMAGEALPELMRVAGEDPDMRARGNAIVALGLMGEAAKAAVPVLIEALESGNEEIQMASAEALGRIGPASKAAVPSLMKRAEDGPLWVSGDAIRALGRIGPASLPALPFLIRNMGPEGRNRAWTAIAIGRLGHGAREAAPALIDLLQAGLSAMERTPSPTPTSTPDPSDPLNRRPPGPSPWPPPRRFYDCKEMRLASAAARGLGGLGADAAGAVPLLIAAVKTSGKLDPAEFENEFELPIDAALALAEIAPGSPDAIDCLIQALPRNDAIRNDDRKLLPQRGAITRYFVHEIPPEDRTVSLSDAYIYALGRAGAPALGPMLSEIDASIPQLEFAGEGRAEELEWRVSRYFAAIASMGADGRDALPRLRQYMNHPCVALRAACTLGAIGPAAQEAVPAIAALADSPGLEYYSGRSRAELVYGAVVRIADPSEAMEICLNALRDGNERTHCREAAISALSGLPALAPQWVSRVIEIALSDSESTAMRSAALRTLGRCGQAAAPSAVPLAELYITDLLSLPRPAGHILGELKYQIFAALSSLGPAAHDAGPILEDYFIASSQRDPSYDWTNVAVADLLALIEPEKARFYRTIGCVGPATPDSVSLLIDILDDPDMDRWHRQALVALNGVAKGIQLSRSPRRRGSHEFQPEMQIDLAPATEVLRHCAESTDSAIHTRAVSALESMGEAVEDASGSKPE